MPHMQVKVFPCNVSIYNWEKQVETEINAFIEGKDVVEIIPFDNYIIVRYRTNGVY